MWSVERQRKKHNRHVGPKEGFGDRKKLRRDDGAGGQVRLKCWMIEQLANMPGFGGRVRERGDVCYAVGSALDCCRGVEGNDCRSDSILGQYW